jgi:pre-mRNA-processing factor SLU7
VKEALKRLEDKEKAAIEADGTKRKFNSLDSTSEMVTPEEMEAFRLKKLRADDPLTNPVVSNGISTGNGGYDYL